MSSPTYKQKLKDPRWQKKRLKVLERDDWKCTRLETDCGDGFRHDFWYHSFDDHAIIGCCDSSSRKVIE